MGIVYDLTGQTFYSLTVERMAERKELPERYRKTKDRFYWVRCKCGKVLDEPIPTSYLLREKVRCCKNPDCYVGRWRICPVCHKKFLSKYRQTICSKECRISRRNALKRTKSPWYVSECRGCAIKFSHKKKFYCSTKCKRDDIRQKISKGENLMKFMASLSKIQEKANGL